MTELIVKQHLNRQYNIAVPLMKDDRTDYLVLEYKGEEHQRFYYLIQHLFKTMHIETYHIYQGKVEERIQVFIEVDRMPLDEAEERLQEISNHLKQKLTKRWKCLPSTSLPEAYNIVSLPYKML